MHTQALKYLNEERMLNIAMSEAVRRGNAEILSAERGAVLLREKNSGVYMLYARDYAPGEALLNLLLERDDVRELSVTRADLAARRRNCWDSGWILNTIMWPIWRTVRRNLRAVWRSAPVGGAGWRDCRSL